MDVCMYQYIFEKGDKVTDILNPDHIPAIRKKYANNCYGFACDYRTELLEANILASVITFTNENVLRNGGIKVWSDLIQSYITYTHHSVILLGECVMDILHSDRLIATSEYIKQLKENNPNLCIKDQMTDNWFSSQDVPTPITLEKLETGNW